MQADVLAVLAAPEGHEGIAAAVRLLAGGDALAAATALRREWPASVAAAMLEQARLRPKAEAKLGSRAAAMLLLPDSLEQASRREVAAERARRLVDAGVDSVTDAGAGIGADTIAYAEAGLRVTAIERDPAVASVLRHNVRGLDVEVVEGDALELLPDDGVAYFDPARRTDGRRIFDPEACSPPLSALVAAAGRGPTVVAKMSPSLGTADVPPGWDADWVSTQTEQGRSVVEATLWSPPLGAGVRRAKVLRGGTVDVLSSSAAESSSVDGSSAEGSVSHGSTDPSTEPGSIGRFVYEPDGAVSQAGLGPQLAALLDARLIEPRIAYLTGDRAVDTPFAQRFEVIESMPWSKRAVARRLASYDASDIVVKKRGVTLDPMALRKELLPRLRSRTGDPVVLLLTPQSGGVTALLAAPADPPPQA